ncbi:MAG: asparagine synthase (glutamine-hydrolyzing) [Steroidobacteraceae bacterium]
MCGLAGIHFDDAAARPDPAMLRRMIAAIGHRGPDGDGFHDEPGVGLGHARLSIIDLAGGAQPIWNEERTIAIVYNGEVFNYPELRAELIAKGHRFTTTTDTECLVHLYEQEGDAFVERLNGQFAFALWDRNRRRLILCRDRAGILPLYWCRVVHSQSTGSAVVFGSEIKALFVSGLVRPEPDPEGLDELWTFWAPVPPRTAFKGIEQLRPGEMIILSGSTITRRQYWRWEFPLAGDHRRAPLPGLTRELTELLGDATQIRLRADVPVGAYLSGGLDSSSLVALLSRSIAKSLHTFSIGFDDPGLDESAHQRAVADHLQTRHHHFQCTTPDIAATFPDAIRHTENPVLRTAPAPMRLLSRSVRQAGLKVVLTGEGADEVLGGYDIFKEAKVRQFWARNPGSPWRPLLLKRLYPYLDLTSAQGDAYLKEFFGQGLADPGDPFFSHQPRWTTTAQCKMFWSADFAASIQGSALERLRAALPAEMPRWHPFNRAEYLEATTLLPSYLLSSQGDRMLMANSIEGRFPYLDHRLIAFANALHPDAKMRVLKEKQLLRQAMQEALPASILRRHKQPYRAPDAAAFLDERTPDYVNELTGPAALKRYGYFDPDKVGRLIAKLRRSKAPAVRDNMAFVGILSTQLWHSAFIERTH